MAASFGFSNPPKVSLNLESKAKHGRAAKRAEIEGGGGGEGGGDGGPDAKRRKFERSGHAFSADNPYGKRQAGDTRQFTRI